MPRGGKRVGAGRPRTLQRPVHRLQGILLGADHRRALDGIRHARDATDSEALRQLLLEEWERVRAR